MTSKLQLLAEQEAGSQSQMQVVNYLQAATGKLRERVLCDMCAVLVKPSRVLAIGEQSVKAALPLAELGYEVTALLDSKTILDYRLRVAEALPVNFKLGEAFDLPFADQQFDTVLGAGLCTRTVDLRALLVEWQRVSRPAGRIIFDCLALEHFADSVAFDSQNRPFSMNVTDLTALSSEALSTLEDELGMRVARVISHGAFDMDAPNQYWHERLEQKQWWKRFISLLQIDDELLELAVFLELDLIGFLPPWVAPKLMIALDKQVDDMQENWQARHTVFLSQARQGIDFELIRSCYTDIGDAWRSKLNALLKPLRNRVFFYNLLSEIRLLLPQLNSASFLDETHASQFRIWDKQNETNSQVMEIAKGWYDKQLITNPSKHERELSRIVGQSLEYMLAQQLFACFQNKN